METLEKVVKEMPILFSGEMVRAILDGRKTQTRRVITPQPEQTEGGFIYEGRYDSKRLFIAMRCRHGQPGDRLWVKETFYDSRLISKRCPWTYRADISIDEDLSRDFTWKPSIFMPRIASRITLEIVGVRVEKLNDISGDDCAADGIEPQGIGSDMAMVSAYKRLWESINGKGSWAKNPWVWCIEFQRV